MNVREARTIEDLPARFNAAHDLIAPNLTTRGAKIAVIDCDGATTYSELALAIIRMSGVFDALGLRPGRRVLLCMTDTVAFPIVFLGAIRAGLVPVPLSTMLGDDDYRWMLSDSGAGAVFVSTSLSDRWTRSALDAPSVRFVSVGAGPWPSFDRLLTRHGNTTAVRADTHREDMAFWLYTSGSTSRPKGVVHNHASMRLTANLFGLAVAGYRANDVVLSVSKQFFAYGLGNALTFPFAAGATVVLHDGRATPAAITELMRRHTVSVLAGVPTFFAKWLASGLSPTAAEVPGLRLALSAGERLPASVGQEFRGRFGLDLLDGIGSTEMLHIFLSQRPGSVRYGRTGRPVPGYEVRLIDKTGAPVAVGRPGELQVSGPTAAIGYWHNAAKSRATFQGHWVNTGDTFTQDADGWYTYNGRIDDMLKVGGLYVSPVEIEEALLEHTDVVEAAVVGALDGDGLEKPRAHVVLSANCGADASIEDQLRVHAKALLAPHKNPCWFRFVDSLPKTANGKVQRFLLRDTDGV